MGYSLKGEGHVEKTALSQVRPNPSVSTAPDSQLQCGLRPHQA